MLLSTSGITNIIIIVVVLLLAALFTLLEYSVVKVRPSELDDMEQTKNVQHAKHMVNNLTEYLSTAQVGVTMTSLILGWVGDEFITNLLLQTTIFPKEVTTALSPILGILIFTFVHAVFTDLVPKNIAIDQPVRILLAIVRPVMFFHTLFYPFVWLFAVVAGFFTRLLGFSTHPEEDTYSQSEIVTLSQQSEQAGEMDKDDVLFMKRAFEMNDKVAIDIMVDRTQLTTVNNDVTVKEAAQLYFDTTFSRFPVVQNNDKDHIIGYIFSYDIMWQNSKNPNDSITKIIRKIPTVYDSASLTNVLEVMVERRVPIVVVQDEYGGTSGIVTDKDIYEEIFGDVHEEMEHTASDLITKTKTDSKGNSTYRVSGKLSLDDFERYFDIEIPQFDETDVTTLTGFFLEEQYNLQIGKPILVDNFSFTPLDLQDAYVNNYKVTRISKDDLDKDSLKDENGQDA